MAHKKMDRVEREEIAPGLTISRVITGLWQVADIERRNGGTPLDPVQTAGALQSYFNNGFTTFDMADHYGSAELIVGAFIESLSSSEADQKEGLLEIVDGDAAEHDFSVVTGSPTVGKVVMGDDDEEEDGLNRIQILTKWVPPIAGLHKVTRDDVRAAVQKALDRLRVSQIDLFQYHCWNFSDPIWLDTLFWLQECKDEGLIRYLGVTNFDTAHLRMALTSGIQITTNQVSYSLLDQRAAVVKSGSGSMAALCLEFGVHLLAFGTLAGGFLTEKWLDQPEPDWDTLESWSLQKYGRYIRQVGGWTRFQTLLSTVSQIAQRHDVSMANVACRYILDQPAVAGIIIGARLGESNHVEDNRKLALLELNADCHSQLQVAFSLLLPLPGDCGDEYRKPPYLTASGDLSHHLSTAGGDDNGSSLPFAAPYPTETISIPTVNAHGQATTIQRMRVSTSTPWEAIAGYSRAVREGSQISVSGTTATHGHHVIGGTDPVSQTHFIIDKIEGCIQSLGGRLEHVVRTRIYVPNIQDWEAVARAHGERFDHIWPVNTLVQAGLVGSDYLVEIEAEAVIRTD